MYREELVDVRDAQARFKEMEGEILRHLLLCIHCKPGVRCIDYLSLKAKQNGLQMESSKYQDN